MKGLPFLLAAGWLLGGCGAPSAPGSSPTDGPAPAPTVASAVTRSVTTVTAPSGGVAPLPPAAEAVARAYASAVASYRFDGSPSADLAELESLSTPQWLGVLRAQADAVTGGEWDQVIANREVAVARVVSVHPSRGAAPARRAVVALRVEVSGVVATSRAAVINVDVIEVGGSWLVGFAS